MDGRQFATARGWEDLSELIRVYEDQGKTADRDVVYQYVQHRTAAKDFANYLELYYKYKKDYSVEDILEGKWDAVTVQKIEAAPLDEHLSIVSLLNGKLSGLFAECFRMDSYVSKLYEYLICYRDSQSTMMLEDVLRIAEKDLEDQKRAELLTREEEKTMLRVIETLEKFSAELKGELFIGDAAFDEVRDMFNRETDALTSMLTQTSAVLENAFRFLEDAFGESQEMVAFVTELNANYYGTWFIRENGCDLYYRYNKGLLFDERQQEIVRQMDEVEEMLNTAIRT